MKRSPISSLLGAAGLAASAAAQPTLVNLSGATLLENFLKVPAATNDYLDCDGDGIAGILGTGVDQLCPSQSTSFGPDDFWVVTYRVAGSVAGYQELVNYGQAAAGNCASPSSWPGLFVTGANGLVNPPNVVFGNQSAGPIQLTGASKQYYNGLLLYDTTVVPNVFAPIYRPENPAGLPVAANLATLRAVVGAPSNGGYRVDLAPVDVPSTWAVRGGGTSAAAAPNRLPGQPGYGRNPRIATNAQGQPSNYNYLLADLGIRNLNTSSPDCNTIFDSPLFFAPIAPITSFGTGIQQLDQTEVNFFFSTGRLKSGMNLVAVTREIGSGTRNGFNNTGGIDPSWGVGDNIGGQDGQIATTGNTNILGNEFAPSNKVGNGDVETTVRNHRLAIGYVGAERLTTARARQYDFVAVRCSLAGGTAYARPTLDNLLNNRPGIDPGLYSIGGPSILASIGDPRAGGVVGGEPNNTNPRVANPQAAAFVNNITRSIEDFVSVPQNVNNVGMPGELAATLFIPSSARRYRNSVANPAQLEVNPAYNPSLAAVLPQYSVLNNPPINAPFGSQSLDGQTPFRKNGPGIIYSDGVANGATYLTVAGVQVQYNVDLTKRNRIAGDFNGDGVRDINDALEMLKAFRMRNGGPTWVPPNGTGSIAGAPGSDAIIEVLGDFNGDGNFDAADIRYWADGLAIDPATGKLNRRKGFEAIDNTWQTLTGNNNFFGTSLAGGAAYQTGWSRFDVSGPGANHTRGAMPVGQDGVINSFDVQYVRDQFINNPFVTGDANWDDPAEAVGFDLSADMTGDLIVNQDDVNQILSAICYPDCNGDGILGLADFGCFQTKFALGDPYADCNGDGILGLADFGCFQTKFALGCP
jgi:hypothetical protein